MKKYAAALFVCLSLFAQIAVAQSDNVSQYLYNQLKPHIVQIKIISKKSDEKAAIGSGFLVEKDHLIATNYHVISQIATQPDYYHGQYRTTDNQLGNFELIAFDVINDLALLRADTPVATPLKIAPLPAQGESLFSLGNPHDLGFVIVDGVNNGIIPKQDPPRVFFSGSINAGMSGGPTVNEDGNVVAVNVSVRRDSGDISFLVPASALHVLIQSAKAQHFMPPKDPKTTYTQSINEQLRAESARYFSRLQGFERDYIRLGNLRIPSQIGADFKCWGLDDDEDEEKALVERSGVYCRQNRGHYISEEEQQGGLYLTNTYFKAKSPISRRRFYRYVTRTDSENNFSFGHKDNNDHPAKCISHFVMIASHEFKLHICSQADKKRTGLANTRILATSVNKTNEAWVIDLRIDGSSTQDALNLSQSILSDITSATN